MDLQHVGPWGRNLAGEIALGKHIASSSSLPGPPAGRTSLLCLLSRTPPALSCSPAEPGPVPGSARTRATGLSRSERTGGRHRASDPGCGLGAAAELPGRAAAAAGALPGSAEARPAFLTASPTSGLQPSRGPDQAALGGFAGRECGAGKDEVAQVREGDSERLSPCGTARLRLPRARGAGRHRCAPARAPPGRRRG